MKLKETCSLCKSKNNFVIKYILPKFNILECKRCHLLTRGTVFSTKEIDNIYSKDYFCKLQKDYFSAGISKELENSLRFTDFKNRLKKIVSYSKIKNGKILDIGSATGIFLKISKDQGWSAYGVEVSKFACQFARKKFKLNVFCGQLNDAKYKSDFFDVITGWDLIEHVEQPDELIKESKRILRNGGVIALQTTMVDSLLFKVADLVYQISFGKIYKLVEIAYPIHHSNHFSRKTIKKLLLNNGLQIVKIDNVEMYYEETSLPKWSLIPLKIFSLFAILTGNTVEAFIMAKK